MTRSEGRDIGVIGEDETDCATLEVLIKRLTNDATKVLKHSGNGGTEIFRHGQAWMNLLAKAGCRAVVIMHDLDRDPRNGKLNDERALKERLQKKFLSLSA